MSVTTKDLAEICGVSRTTVIRALQGTGRISAHRLLIRFKDFTIIKLGMIPALNISVNTTIPMKSLWNGILFFVST